MKQNERIKSSYLERLLFRQKRQQELTKISKFNADFQKNKEKHQLNVNQAENGYIRVLSEGIITDSEGNPYTSIAKGSIQEWYDKLDPSDVFEFSIAHDTTNPLFSSIGVWNKDSLKLEVAEDGRTNLFVQPIIDEESLAVQELLRTDYLLGLSVEFYSTGKEVEFESNKIFNHEHLDIYDISFVREPADAMTGGFTMNDLLTPSTKEVMSVPDNQWLNNLKQLFSIPEVEVEETVEEEVAEEVEEEVTDEEVVEEVAEEVEEEIAEEVEEEAEEEAEEEVEIPFVTKAEFDAVVIPLFENVSKQMADLQNQLETMTSELSQVKTFSVSKDSKTQHKFNDENKKARKVGF